jgi:hypothetical protein
MKKGIILIPLLFISVLLKSQDGDRIQAMKVAFITNKVGLTTEESQKLWPLYNEFEKNEKAVRNQYRRPNSNLAAMTDEEADSALDDYFLMEEKLLALKKDFYQELRAFMPARKIMLLHRAEKQFNVELLKTLQERRQTRRNNRN